MAVTEDEMVGQHHQLNGHEFEQTLGDSEGQGSLACCSPWGCRESDMTWQLNNNIGDEENFLNDTVKYQPVGGETGNKTLFVWQIGE